MIKPKLPIKLRSIKDVNLDNLEGFRFIGSGE